MTRCFDTCCTGDREDDVPTVQLRTSAPRARKEHLCAHCYRPIQVGQRYVRDIWIIDGAFTTIPSHDGLGYCTERETA